MQIKHLKKIIENLDDETFIEFQDIDNNKTYIADAFPISFTLGEVELNKLIISNINYVKMIRDYIVYQDNVTNDMVRTFIENMKLNIGLKTSLIEFLIDNSTLDFNDKATVDKYFKDEFMEYYL